MSANPDMVKARVLNALAAAYGADEAERLWTAIRGGEIDEKAWELFVCCIQGIFSSDRATPTEIQFRELQAGARDWAAVWVGGRK